MMDEEYLQACGWTPWRKAAILRAAGRKGCLRRVRRPDKCSRNRHVRCSMA